MPIWWSLIVFLLSLTGVAMQIVGLATEKPALQEAGLAMAVAVSPAVWMLGFVVEAII